MWAGFLLPSDKVLALAWGARGIFKDGQVDILPDRQGFRDTDSHELLLDRRKRFAQWAELSALRAMRSWIRNEGITGNSSEVFAFDDGPRHLRATPNASYGYMLGPDRTGSRCPQHTGPCDRGAVCPLSGPTGWRAQKTMRRYRAGNCPSPVHAGVISVTVNG